MAHTHTMHYLCDLGGPRVYDGTSTHKNNSGTETHARTCSSRANCVQYVSRQRTCLLGTACAEVEEEELAAALLALARSLCVPLYLQTQEQDIPKSSATLSLI